jgi:hypothetical protein
MKLIDFFYLSPHTLRAITFGFLICFALPVIAKPPVVETFDPPRELDLSLPDKYREPGKINNSRTSKRIFDNQQSEAANEKKPNIGCGMDVTPLASSDASFGNRVVGKCKLSYNY